MSELQKKLKHYRISESEYKLICDLLGRAPLGVEWALFSALWSEHCSYKSSKVHLKKFSKTINQSVVTSEGENAGIIDIGENEKIVFKMESHNHPSFIEPYQGAATGVGGILRDIFTMGAKPIAIADYLCFGDLSAPKQKSLLKGVVAGIGGYGNSVGVPTITGQTEFHSSYNKNILVNAFCVGLIEPGGKVALSKAQGPGNFVVYIGAKTGKDGVHGASMASESFGDDTDKKKPNVQIGDPFFEKLLIEACLEIISKNLVVAIQDMGAAGLTSSSFEMAAKGGVGMRLDLDQVPLRDSSMLPEEILLSESQERMLCVCEPDKLPEIEEILNRWGLEAKKIGSVTVSQNVELFWRQEKLTSIDPQLLVEKAPKYERAFKSWVSTKQVQDLKFTDNSTKILDQLESALQADLFTSRKNIYRQYDSRVGIRTAHGCEHDVGFLKLPSGRGLSVALGCRPSLMRLDARLGGFDSVFYPSLQMAIKGAKPVGVTDCLNFGNPEKVEVMSEFVAAVEAIKEASIFLNAPVISGNVSFYNETFGENITSTPATGVVGLRASVENLPTDWFVAPDHDVVLVKWKAVKAAFDKSDWLSFSGNLNPQDFSQWILGLSKVCQTDVFSSQVVGSRGLAGVLALMSTKNVGMKWDSNEVLSDVRCLYEVVLEVPHYENFSKTLFDVLASEVRSQVEVVKLGRTLKDSLNIQQRSWPTSTVQTAYEKGLPL